MRIAVDQVFNFTGIGVGVCSLVAVLVSMILEDGQHILLDNGCDHGLGDHYSFQGVR